MNLGKVKSFLIILFLGINIYLIATNFMASRFYENKETIDGCVQILEKSDITLDRKLVPPYTTNLKGVEAENVIYTNPSLGSDKKGFKIYGNSFSMHIRDDDMSDKTILRHLKENGFDTSCMKIKKSKNKDIKYIECKIGGYTVFDSTLKVQKKDGGILISGSWYEPKSRHARANTKSRETTYVTSILVNILQNEDIMKNAPFEIKSISYGYLAGLPYGTGQHRTTTALPYYRIKDSKGNIYYFDASNGEYLKN